MGNLTCVQLPERHFYSQGQIMEDILNDWNDNWYATKKDDKNF
jgi:hypothetical protein